MNKFVVALLVVLIALVTALGVLVWRADQHSQQEAARERCIQRVQATAMIGLLAPASRVDPEGRLRAMSALSARLDDC
jgi:hypothetical protein